jgi:predicted ATPase/C4-dicarboxylate-specific signal transduction histidine kinase
MKKSAPETLRQRLEREPMSTVEAVETARAVAVELGVIHQSGRIARCVSPDHVKLESAGVIGGLDGHAWSTESPDPTELAYMAPEDTGRTDQERDHRADLYALGVTLYELLTGHVPFSTRDPLELIHQHLAVVPAAPHVVDARVPRIISNITMRLLEKAPEDRYQTADGVAADLARCAAGLRRKDTTPFELASNERPPVLTFPSRLYGRDDATDQLTDTFERTVRRGGVTITLVAGGAGVGKTSFVGQLLPKTLEHGGYFADGKFEQLESTAPYLAITRAFRRLVRRFLTEDDASAERWRRYMESELGASADVLTMVVPELEALVGPRPPLPRVGPQESRARFRFAFQRLTRALARREHPLVLFLDDLQWADSASLDVLSHIAEDDEIECLHLVQAYRDDEIDAAHPFSQTLEDQRRCAVPIDRIVLSPFEVSAVQDLLRDVLNLRPSEVRSLAEQVTLKTGGNPFFVRQLVSRLYDERVIDHANGRFFLDEGRVTDSGETIDVLDVVAQRIAQLPASTRRVLCVGAALGSRFRTALVARICDVPFAEVSAACEIAQREELVRRDDGEDDVFAFVHDRVQQSCYESLPHDERGPLHVAIARALLSRNDDEEPQRIFKVADHVRRGREAIADADRKDLVEVLLEAAALARATTALAATREYLETALEFMGDETWTTHAALAWEATFDLAEVIALANEPEQSFALVAGLETKSADPMQRARLLELKTRIFCGLGDLRVALDSALEAASILGMTIPTDGDAIGARIGFCVGSIMERTADADDLLDRPFRGDDRVELLMHILMGAAPAAFQVDPKLLALICAELVMLTLEHGNCPVSAYAYGAFGCALAAGPRDFANAYRFGKIGYDLNRKLGDIPLRPASHFIHAAFCSPWQDPMDFGIELFPQVVAVGLEAGDLIHASYSACTTVERQIHMGRRLQTIEADEVRCATFLERTGDLNTMEFLRANRQFARSMRGELPSNATLDGPDFSEDAFEAACEESGNFTHRSLLEIARMKHRYIFGRFDEAFRFAQAADRHPSGRAGFAEDFDRLVFGALAHARLWADADADERAAIRQRLADALREVSVVAELNPNTFGCFHELLLGEQQILEEHPYEAQRHLDRAARLAADHGRLHLAAIARERAARCWQDRGRTDLFESYLRAAQRSFERWGATAKVDALEAEIRAEFGTRVGAQPMDLASLDLGAVLQGAQAIATELDPDKLALEILTLVTRSVGATTGALLLRDDDGELVVSSRVGSHDEAARPAGTAATRIPERIVRYATRMKETLVLQNPADSDRFRDDPHVAATRPKSILCAPFYLHDRLEGVLYAENDKVGASFTPERLAALEILLSQASVSVNNARLFATQRRQAEELAQYQDRLEVLVEERTRQLQEVQRQLVDASREAGMAEVATSVLHDVGNVLNSVNVGVHTIRDRLQQLRVDGFERAIGMFETDAELAAVISGAAKGPKLVEYLGRLTGQLESDRDALAHEAEQLVGRVDHIKTAINKQQHHARTVGFAEPCDLRSLLVESANLFESSYRANAIELEVQCETTHVEVDRARILRIIANLLSNAEDALLTKEDGPRRVVLRASVEDGRIVLVVDDNGPGIQSGALEKIFGHGYTTREHGHGFGLHDSCNAARAMGGSLVAASEGRGRGASFTLEIPAEPTANAARA